MSDCKCQTENCVKCSATNCKYHTDNDTCLAGNIWVGKRTAQTSFDTYCDTFENRD